MLRMGRAMVPNDSHPIVRWGCNGRVVSPAPPVGAATSRARANNRKMDPSPFWYGPDEMEAP